MWTSSASWALRATMVGSLLLVVAGAPPAWAAGSCDRDPKCAALAEQGREALSRGDFAVALSAYESAHSLRPTPKLLYNIARVLHKAGRYGEAIARYQDYLREGTAEPPQQLAKAQLFLADAQAHEEARQRPPPEPPSPPPTVAEKSLERPSPAPPVERRAIPRWRVGVGISLLLAGSVAGGFGVSALAVHGSCRPLPTSAFDPCVEQYGTLAIGSGLLGAGAAAALVGVLFIALPGGRASPPKSAQARSATEHRL